jgi:hypothetical protein
MDKGGHVIVDEYQNTSVDKIYALGDVCGKAHTTWGQPYLTQINHTWPRSTIQPSNWMFTEVTW